MKKIIYTTLIAVAATIMIISTVNAKRMKPKTTPVTNNTEKQTGRTTIPVTKNTKDMLTNTQNLKRATTPEEVITATQKVEENIKKDPFSRLKLEEIALRKEIVDQKELITTQSSYISYFDSEEVKEAKENLIDLETDLKEVQTKLGTIVENQPAAVSKLKYYALGTLIGTIGLAAVLQHYGYNVTGNISSAAKTVWGATPSASGIWGATKTAWGYGSNAVTIGLVLFNARSLARHLSAEIAGEEGKPNPDQEILNELYEQLEEQNNRIADLEAKAAKEPK